MNRRHFLQLAATASALPALTAAGRVFAAPPSSPRFLLVFLRGGYDCANMLVPYSSDFYYQSRPNIAVPRPDAKSGTGALALDSEWALAPALRDSIGEMYKNRQVAFVPFAGTDDMSRSHFETQDNIERGEPTQAHVDFNSGFMARLSGTLSGKAPPIAFTDALPLTFRGANDIPNISLKYVGKPAYDDRQSAILTSMYQGNRLQAAVNDGLELRAHVAKEFETEMNQANRGAVNAQGFALEAQRIAKLMRDQYRLGFLDIGGWDTHVNEGGAQGQLANNLANLGNGLKAFAQELGPEWKNTVVVVVSEFGRTFRENGNHGTDHGHGSVYWVLGGGIDGGRIAGEQVKVQQSTLLQNRDYPVLNNYRSLLAGMYLRMWGLSPAQLAKVFPDTKTADLRLV
ncbi:MAG: DUF1501 domain-containing protein [Rudaea sp.]|uniref:DUF1501 domain-containing protein n=1 Tax=unclassified Rudaea TaxID=2627037 RepID=UPI0010F83D92|nr:MULTISPECIES: DUF1501 domain-containing protein [unclassified Rudaea]MBN8885610.1 DUF1501 domain-containing protein [Rudaea sp.]MBR0345351.1 DUF1501 domain-containing protein [Rudaea sp.]